jgi:hypothetical protein
VAQVSTLATASSVNCEVVGKNTLIVADVNPALTTNLDLKSVLLDLEGHEVILNELGGDTDALPTSPVLMKDLETRGTDRNTEAVVQGGKDRNLSETSGSVPLLKEGQILAL